MVDPYPYTMMSRILDLYKKNKNFLDFYIFIFYKIKFNLKNQKNNI
jgi:hypothetical protein